MASLNPSAAPFLPPAGGGSSAEPPSHASIPTSNSGLVPGIPAHHLVDVSAAGAKTGSHAPASGQRGGAARGAGHRGGEDRTAGASQPALPATAAKLFVGQLPFEITEERLKELFGAYGTVVEVHLIKTPKNESKGAAFVTFSTTEEADTAIYTLHNRYRLLTNRAVQVSYAQHSPNFSRFGKLMALEVHQLHPSNPKPAGIHDDGHAGGGAANHMGALGTDLLGGGGGAMFGLDPLGVTNDPHQQHFAPYFDAGGGGQSRSYGPTSGAAGGYAGRGYQGSQQNRHNHNNGGGGFRGGGNGGAHANGGFVPNAFSAAFAGGGAWSVGSGGGGPFGPR